MEIVNVVIEAVLWVVGVAGATLSILSAIVWVATWCTDRVLNNTDVRVAHFFSIGVPLLGCVAQVMFHNYNVMTPWSVALVLACVGGGVLFLDHTYKVLRRLDERLQADRGYHAHVTPYRDEPL